jgi:restriction alleviation protein Lar
MNELLPCPFCGGRGKIESYTPESAAGPRYLIHFGCCIPCEMRLRGHVERKWAVLDWNRRANRWTAFSPEELEKLRRELQPDYSAAVGFACMSPLKNEISSELARREGQKK